MNYIPANIFENPFISTSHTSNYYFTKFCIVKPTKRKTSSSYDSAYTSNMTLILLIVFIAFVGNIADHEYEPSSKVKLD